MNFSQTESTSSRVWQGSGWQLGGYIQLKGFVVAAEPLLPTAPLFVASETLELLEDEADAEEAERRYRAGGSQGYTLYRDFRQNGIGSGGGV